MDQEQSWISVQTVGEDDNTAATNYEYFMRPEPRENLGPIREINDLYLGRVKVRDLLIGMTRNAKEENKKQVVAYLHPYPHTRIDKAKPLQGWYKSLHEPPGVRPRPCFTEAILTEPYGGWCLPAGALVETPSGPISIERLRPGNAVFGVNQEGSLVSSNVLASVSRISSHGLVKLTVEGGESILLTAEHPVFSLSRMNYVPAGEVSVNEKIETWAVSDVLNSAPGRRLGQYPEVLPLSSVFPSKDGSARGRKVGPNYSRMGLSDTDVQQYLRVSNIRPLSGVRYRSAEEPRPNATRSQDTLDHRSTQNSRSTSEAGGGANRQEALGSYEGTVRGTSSTRCYGAEAVSEEPLYLSPWQDVQPPVFLGASSGRVARQDGTGMGLRTAHYPPEERRLLLTGLPTGERDIHRGKGVYGRSRPQPHPASQEPRSCHQGVRRASDEASRSATVTAVDRLPTPVQVYDIQTTTENFLTRGVLGLKSFHVHNCAVGCVFCYVNSGFRGYRGTGLITVPLDYGEQIRVQLSKMRRAAAGYFSSFTDPFTPLEDYYHNTQRAAEEFVKVGLPLFFLSRLRYPDWAIKLLKQNPHSYAQKSINTSNPDDWRYLSPGALPLAEHYKDITRLRKAGVYVSIQVNPIVPGVTSHEDIARLFRDLSQAGANHVIVKFVEAGYSWAPAMVERMIKRFGDRGRRFADLFTENIGGQRTICEDYRLPAHDRYSAWAKKYGLTYATCYEYAYQRDAHGKILSKVGESIGRKYTTSSQCHGHTVPMYTRESENELFRPVEECPPSGCLYCASENEGKARCGDELAGQANALRFPDLRVPIGQGKARLLELPVLS